MSDAVDKMLAGMAANRQTMNRQLAKIDEIMERSNNTLLHIESNSKAFSQNVALSETQKMYNLRPEAEMALSKILDNFKLLMSSGDQREEAYSALEGCLAYRHRVEHLGSSVRKLVALYDTVGQMKSSQEEQYASEDSP
ncbi:augmin complex subunit msd1 [Drosophila mauritiana]|uniref:Augmin complex subunit msd1 n=1 Tax=Drosophila mauritiana TaxID=7226 RepID=A0A6P8JPL0_DROMA|nr:augmin complex subunit msd1 [Drosophila mauritiana]